ncbi:hypothetical protein ACRBEV_03275 [Methylobacterium phyllosphaerae]
MSTSDKTDDIRPSRKRSGSALPPVLRRGRAHRIVRWIGAANRKANKRTEDSVSATPEAPKAHIIKLSWADTFGRPGRVDAGRSGAIPAAVLPFESRKTRSAPQPTPRRAADQPPVPVLR